MKFGEEEETGGKERQREREREREREMEGEMRKYPRSCP